MTREFDEPAGEYNDDENGRRDDDRVEESGGDLWQEFDSELLPRPAPPGMSRKDRKLWRELEGERLAAAVQNRRTMDGFRGGFPGTLPRDRRGLNRTSRPLARRLGRKGWKAFRQADRANRAAWWERKRREGETERAAGAPVIVIGLLVAVLLLMTLGTDDEGSPASTTVPATPSVSGTATATTVTASTARRSVTESLTTAAGAAGGSVEPSATSGAGSPPVSTAAVATGTAGSSPAGGDASTDAAVFGNGTNTSTSVGTSSMAAPGVVAVEGATQTVASDPGEVGPVPASARKQALSTARSWFATVCESAWTEPFGSRYTATKAAMTGEAWALADPARNERLRQQWWEKSVVAGQETRTCTYQAVDKFQGPFAATADRVAVSFVADRQVTSELPGVAARVEKVNELRVMVRGRDGLWSVGPAVLAG